MDKQLEEIARSLVEGMPRRWPTLHVALPQIKDMGELNVEIVIEGYNSILMVNRVPAIEMWVGTKQCVCEVTWPNYLLAEQFIRAVLIKANKSGKLKWTMKK